ncbi:MAG: hypothetical protein V7682_05360 [Cycloclasticus sp.]
MRISSAILTTIVLLLNSFTAGADNLQRDPFQKPDLSRLVKDERVGSNQESAASWSPFLKGTLRSASGSFANLDGKIIKVGEEFEGFSLVAVSERSATFLKDGEKVVLRLEDSFENGAFGGENNAQ